MNPSSPSSPAAAGAALLKRISPQSPEDLRALHGKPGSALADYIVEFAYGQVLSRPYIGIRRRELLTLAMLTSLGAPEGQLRFHLRAALQAGASPEEVFDTFYVASIYAGFPAVINASRVLDAVLQERGLEPPRPWSWPEGPDRHGRGLATLEATSGEAGREVIDGLRRVSPDLADALVDYVYGEVFARPVLDPATKELVQIAAAGARGGMLPQLKVHVQAALNVGAAPAEILDVAHQLAVYAGFPAALNAAAAIGEVVEGPPPTPPGAELRWVHAAGLEANRLGDSADQPIMVHLPPSYGSGARRYPVVYFLAGYGNRVGRLLGRFIPAADRYFRERPEQEFILVEVNGQNRLGGSFWANSPVTGQWEDLVVREVPAFVDRHYRTVRAPEGRGLAGYSMGGFAAVAIGLKRPEVFGQLSAFSPGLIRPGDEEAALLTWAQSPVFKLAYGAAFAPDPEAPYPHARIDEPGGDPAVRAAWASGFGEIERRVGDYDRQPRRLAAIRVSWGEQDSYGWIPRGARYFCELMKARKHPCQEESFAGGHELPEAQFASGVLGFFGPRLRQGP